MTEEGESLEGFAERVDRLRHYRAREKPPPGWAAAGSWETRENEGTYTGVSTSSAIEPDEANILDEMGLDPEAWQIVDGSLQVRKWQSPIGKVDPDTKEREPGWLWYYRVTVERRTRSAVELDEFVQAVRKAKPRKAKVSNGAGAQIWATSDHQVGKKGSLDRLESWLSLPDRFESSWRLAGKPDTVAVLFGGDHGEGCRASYGGIAYQIELNEREQRRVFREVAHRIIDRASGLASSVTVAVVGGNHGEVREARGVLATDVADNRDVASVEDVRYAMRDHDRWAHVSWLVPDDDLVVCLEVEGVRVALAHGHQFGGGHPVVAVEKWWDRQAGNHRPAGAADLLISGHRHHFAQYHMGPRTWIQLPAEDNGSPGFAESFGAGAPRPGSITVDVLDGELGLVRLV